MRKYSYVINCSDEKYFKVYNEYSDFEAKILKSTHSLQDVIKFCGKEFSGKIIK